MGGFGWEIVRHAYVSTFIINMNLACGVHFLGMNLAVYQGWNGADEVLAGSEHIELRNTILIEGIFNTINVKSAVLKSSKCCLVKVIIITCFNNPTCSKVTCDSIVNVAVNFNETVYVGNLAAVASNFAVSNLKCVACCRDNCTPVYYRAATVKAITRSICGITASTTYTTSSACVT